MKATFRQHPHDPSNARTLMQRVNAAPDLASLRKLETLVTRCYDNGILSPADLGRLDTRIMERGVEVAPKGPERNAALMAKHEFLMVAGSGNRPDLAETARPAWSVI